MDEPVAKVTFVPVGTFSYTGDPSTSEEDAVRFLVGDTDPNSYFLNDAEIKFLLDSAHSIGVSNPVLMAAGTAAESIAAKLAREISYSADGVSVSGDTLASKFYTVAEKIRTLSLRSDVAAAPSVGGILVGEVYDPSIRPLTFAAGMHDNYLAGQQDFGGVWEPYYWYAPATTALAAQNRALVQQAAVVTGRVE